MRYEIWQAPLSCPYKFMHYDWITGKKPNIRDYVLVYSGETKGEIKNINEYLEKLFYIFNEEHPADYHSASMSVSDIVCLIGECNHRFWFYVDGIGFKEIEVEE